MKLGVNTVLFKKFPVREAVLMAKRAGYDGVELSAIQGMCEHLVLDEWEKQKDELIALREETGMEFLSMEAATNDRARIEKAFAAAQALGIPLVNIGPGGSTAEGEESLQKQLAMICDFAALAKTYGVTLGVKAHVGAAVYNTPTTLRMMEASADEGVDMDPSHIYRAGEKPEEAINLVISRVKHVHIRDCKGPGPSPGDPMNQACGRGDINLFGYFKVLVENHYDGPVCLEVIGPEQDVADAMAIASESYGYMNAVLKMLGAR